MSGPGITYKNTILRSHKVTTFDKSLKNWLLKISEIMKERYVKNASKSIAWLVKRSSWYDTEADKKLLSMLYMPIPQINYR